MREVVKGRTPIASLSQAPFTGALSRPSHLSLHSLASSLLTPIASLRERQDGPYTDRRLPMVMTFVMVAVMGVVTGGAIYRLFHRNVNGT